MGEVGRRASRLAGPGAGGQGASAHAGPVSRIAQGYSGACQTDSPPPDHHEFLRRVRGRERRSGHRPPDRGRTASPKRNVAGRSMPAPPSGARERRFLDPAVIARLGSLELKARSIVEGFLSGLHRSPFKGFSVEFAEYRQYMVGDDLASIDWKVYARNDRYVVKKFEEETNLDCHLLLDLSASMSYRSGPLTKLEYASYLAASIAYLMTRQRDSVGLIGFDDRI